jgi:predicted RNA-binding Zn-ribbon protein involved in translation (DUF1610 family)
MARVTCRCGFQMNDQSSPNDILLWVYTDKEWDRITYEISEVSEIPNPRYDVWKCPNCGRIYVYSDENFNVPIAIYALEK